MVTCKKTDWSKGMGVPTPVNEATATEVLNYLFNTNTWKTNPDALILKVRSWRQRLFAEAPTPEAMRESLGVPEQAAADTAADAPGDAPGDTWAERAVAMRLAGSSWNQIKAETGKSISTIRDAVKRAGVAA